MNTHTQSPEPHPAPRIQLLQAEADLRKKRKAENDRASKLRRRERARGPERGQSLAFADQLLALAEGAPDDETRRDINRIVHRLQRRVPASASPDERRTAVFNRLDKWREAGLSEQELAEETGLTRGQVREALQALLAPVELVESFTRGGHSNCGRGGTKLYWRIKPTRF